MNHFTIIDLMEWNSDKIKTLRCRLGWTQAELARKLKCESNLISAWESSSSKELKGLELHADALVLLEKQAEVASDQIFQSPLAETILDETRASQVDSEIVKRRFYENN